MNIVDLSITTFYVAKKYDKSDLGKVNYPGNIG